MKELKPTNDDFFADFRKMYQDLKKKEQEEKENIKKRDSNGKEHIHK